MALLLLCVAGCGSFWPVVMPEQRFLDIREESELPQASIPASLPPETVSQRVPTVVVPTQLSLDEAIRIALANSNVIRVLAGEFAVASGKTIYDPAISNTTIDEARSVFDPTLGITNNWTRTEQPGAFLNPRDPLGASISGTRIDDYALGIGLAQRNVLGGTTRLDFTDTVSRFHPGLFPLNPQERSALTLSYNQPLLRGAGPAANLAPIVIARINSERSYFQFKDSVQELVRGVIEAYWNVAFAVKDVAARRKQVEVGQEDFDRADAEFRAKRKSGADVAQVKAALYNFRANLIGAEANLLRREAALRNILGLPPTEPERLTLTTEPRTERLEPDWDEIVRLAGERRPDLIELKLILEADQQTVLLANNQARPQVDGTMFYRWNGLEGHTPTRARLETGSGEFTDWSLGVNFSVPIGLRKDRATLRRAELVVLRDEANLEQGLHSTLHILASTLRNLAQYHEQYLAFKEARKASAENLVAQRARYESGLTIYLNVLQAISSLGDAESAEAQTLSLYNTELANLERDTGTILETHGVRFFEERYGAIGPLGRCGPARFYPSGVVPSENVDRYSTNPKQPPP
jgi:outer membrane protein TolC